MVKNQIICEKKEEIKVKGIAHKVQTYQVVNTKEELVKSKNFLNEEFEGFNLSIDLERIKKEKVIASLKKALHEIE